MANLCPLIYIVVFACAFSNLKHGSVLAQQFTFQVPYDYKVGNATAILANATAIQSAALTLIQEVNITANSLGDYGINATSLQSLQELYNEIVALAENVTVLNSTYQQVLSEINGVNSQFNSAIDKLQCFQNKTTCHPPKGPCYDAPCKNGGTCDPTGNTFTCICTPNFTGATCDIVVCDGTDIRVDANGGRLNSLNFPALISGYNCTWSFTTSQENIVELTINSINTTIMPPGQIYFQVVDMAPSPQQIFFTNTSIAGRTVYSSRSQLQMTFKSGDSINNGSPGSFDISYRSIYFDACSKLPPDYCNHGSCIQHHYAAQCVCSSCFTGSHCNIQKQDPCANNGRCGDNGVCTYDTNTCSSPTCICKANCTAAYSGPFCLTLISQNFDCGNGTCKDNGWDHNPSCTCSDPCQIYSPQLNACILDESHCTSNGKVCGDHGTCGAYFNGTTCNTKCNCVPTCTDAYSGPFCDTATAQAYNCGNGTCKDVGPGRNPTCICSDPCHVYSQTVHACILDESHCMIGGEVCGDHGTCELYNNGGTCGTRCVCYPGFTGQFCDTPI